MLDECEQPLVCPVQVLEDGDQRPLRCDPLEEALPGAERGLRGRGRTAVRGSDERREAADEPLLLRRVACNLADRDGELVECLLWRVGLEDPGLRLEHLAERPVRDAFAVRQRAALAPENELRL